MLPRRTTPLAQPTAILLDRRRLLGFIALSAVPVAAKGADLPPTGASATVARLYGALLTGMKAGGAVGFPSRFATLEPVVDQAFDLPTVLAVSVGPRWTGLSPDQQDQLLRAFRRYTVASYVASFDSYAGQTFSILPEVRGAGADQVLVQTRILSAKGDATELDYVMRQMPSGWKIVDVLADGSISRVAVQRSDFRGLLANGGGDALLASLQRKTADLSGGNLA